MTFSAHARRVAALVRALQAGGNGCGRRLLTRAWLGVYEAPDFGADVIVRGEKDLTFLDLVRALEAGIP
jgi:hypothetical protein